MSLRLIIILILLFSIQIAAYFWSYSEQKNTRTALYQPFQSYLENPETVTALDLSSKGIKELIPEFSKFKNLEYLDLSNNQFSEIPEILFQLPKLKTLILSNNKIIEVYLINNSTIERLDLSHNKLNYSEVSGTFNKLKFIDLSHNSLIILPNFSRFSLDTILINNNTLNDYKSVANRINPSIAHLDLSSNSFKKSKGLDLLSRKCYSLKLDNNKFLDAFFPMSLVINKSIIKHLSLKNCNIKHIFRFIDNQKLTTLNLSNNNLAGSIDFNPFIELESLNLSNCRLKDFELKSESLTKLDFSKVMIQNTLEDFDSDNFIPDKIMFDLPNLEYLKIDCFLIYVQNKYNKGRLTLPNLKQLNGYKCHEDIINVLRSDFPNTKFVLQTR